MYRQLQLSNTMNNTNPKPAPGLALETIFLIIFSTALLSSSVVTDLVSVQQIRGHYPFLILLLVYIGIRAIVRKSYTRWGVFGHWKRSLGINAVVATVFIIFGVVLVNTNSVSQYVGLADRGFGSIYFVIFYIFIGVPLQQLLIWGDLLERLNAIGIPRILHYVLLPAIYSLSHGFYDKPEIILVGTLLLGVCWTYSTKVTESLIGNYVVHVSIGLAMFALQIA